MAIYGANASGKSKLFEAFKFMQCVICPPKREGKIPIFDYWQTEYDPFRLDTESAQNDSFFEAIFVLDNVQYRYGFEINANKITSEWLYQKNQREVQVLSRDADLKTYVNPKYISTKISDNIISAGMMSDAVPFLSILSTFNDALSRSVVDWFEKIYVISANDIRAPHSLSDPKKTEAIVKFLKAFDFNIENLALHELPVEEIPEKIKAVLDLRNQPGIVYDGVLAQHNVYNGLYERESVTNFRLEVDESFGTNRLFHLSWPIISAIRSGSTIMIDEIDSGIHPNIVKVIIDLFNRCCSKAQLIYNTHNSTILNTRGLDERPLLRKDQVYVVNKNRYGESTVKAITDYKGDLRSNLEKTYLSGEISGVPYVNADAILNVLEEN